MSKYIMPATLLCDFYKVSHREQYPELTEVVFSTWTPRMSRKKGIDKVVAFGFQAFIKEYLIGYFNDNFFSRPKEDVVNEYARVLKFTLGVDKPDTSHIEELHDLGYLPLKIRAIKEGTLVPLRVPMLTVENTDPRFFWVTNYIETLMSNELWSPTTSATIAFQYRKILDRYAKETGADTDFVPFQGHDFSMRGMSSLYSSKASGGGHLLSFTGTDTIPAIFYLEEFYGANIEKELVGTSIPATEHSVMSANSDVDTRDEFESYKRLINDVYPSGFFSVVSDTYDFWKVIGEILPKLKDDIMNRDGRVVIRPDSGDPVEILCGKKIEDLTGDKWVKNLEDAKEAMKEIVSEKVREETPHGEHGGDGYGEFKYDGKYYKVHIEFFWNRYDKQYYYIDGIESVKIEEFEPKLSDLGLIESLWNIFGGTVNEKGFKELDSHIGAIYGDSITLERCEAICKRLKEKGFASTNVVLGLGSFSYQFNTRDTFGFAMKATYSVVNGEERLLFKDPKTDDGTKRSQRGRVAVVNVGGELTYQDGLNKRVYETNFRNVDLLEDVFINGELVREHRLCEIRDRLQANLV